jgi:hypothetical protein
VINTMAAGQQKGPLNAGSLASPGLDAIRNEIGVPISVYGEGVLAWVLNRQLKVPCRVRPG